MLLGMLTIKNWRNKMTKLEKLKAALDAANDAAYAWDIDAYAAYAWDASGVAYAYYEELEKQNDKT
jgi:hypothetical protein